MITKVKHEVVPQMRESVAAQFSALKKMEEDLQTAKANLQNMIGAYVLGAKLPSNITFDEDYNIVYEEEVPDPVKEGYGTVESGDLEREYEEEFEEIEEEVKPQKKVVRRM